MHLSTNGQHERFKGSLQAVSADTDVELVGPGNKGDESADEAENYKEEDGEDERMIRSRFIFQ